MMGARIRFLRDFWRCFRHAADLSGTEYISETVRLEMSPVNAEKILTKVGAFGRRTVNIGLWIDNINYNEWLKIFQSELPARRHIRLPDDEEFF
ncbi:hypothetical protein S40293_11521 [Stachybotrys chartarum IBT 40293]|nr:hypothetical protein S40293_11521 [Stachybotrys chartarum IBT 40293]